MNPIYQQYGMRNSTDDFLSRFHQFQKTLQGNPQQMVQQMINSGKFSQDQINRAVQATNQMIRLIK